MDSINNDIILERITPYLNSHDLLNLSLTSKRFGSADSSAATSDGSLIDVAAKRILNAKEEQKNWFNPKYEGETWIGLVRELEKRKKVLSFDRLFGEENGFCTGDGDNNQFYSILGGMRTAVSNCVMRGGKHYVRFMKTGDGAMSCGLIRPMDWVGHEVPTGSYSTFLREYWPRQIAQRTARWTECQVNTITYNSWSGRACWSDWQETTNYSESWEGEERAHGDYELGMLLDLDEGTLAIYKNGRRLGVMKSVSAYLYETCICFLGSSVYLPSSHISVHAFVAHTNRVFLVSIAGWQSSLTRTSLMLPRSLR